MVDIFSPAVLNRVVQDLKTEARTPFLLDRYFRETSVSKSEEIFFDVLTGKPRLSPFVSPRSEGQIVEKVGYATNSFRPAYIKDKRVLEDNVAARRPAGAPIYAGPVDAMAARQRQLAVESLDQIAMLNRRMEWMAAEVLRTGSVTVTGEKYPTTTVDFGRNAGLTVTLTSTARWNDTSPTILDNLESWAGLVRDQSGVSPVDIIMPQNVWASFRKNTEVKELMGFNRYSRETDLELGPAATDFGVTDKGMIGSFHVFIYNDFYVDEAGATQKFLPDSYVLMLSPQLEGVRHFGMIKDEDNQFGAVDYFQKSWREPDPGQRYLMLQSAPLVVPYRINATLAAKVM